VVDLTTIIDDGLLMHEGRYYYAAELIENKQQTAGLEFPIPESAYYSSPDVTWEDVRNASKDIPVVASNLEKYRKFIFQGAKLNVIPPVDESIDDKKLKEVQAQVNTIDRTIRTLVRINQAWYDRKVYGSAVFEYKSGNVNGWKAPIIFKHLPAYSFSDTPSERSDANRYIPGDILKGIIYDVETDTIECWQKINSSSKVLIDPKNVIHIRDEVADSPDGRSALACIIPLCKRLIFAENALTQAVNRAGAPGLWASVEEYRDSPAAVNPDAWTFPKAFKEARKIIQNHGKNTVMVTPSCIKLTPLDYKLAIDPMKVIDHYERRILYTIIARDFTEQTGQAISQSAAPGLTLLILMARSEQDEISAQFIEFWKQIFEANNLPGWSIEIEWRPFIESPDETLYKNADVVSKIGSWTSDEIREIAGWPPLSEDQKAELSGISKASPTTSPTETGIEDGNTDEEVLPDSELLEENAEVVLNDDGKDVGIAEILAMKSRVFLDYCKENGIIKDDKVINESDING